jgi:hypothetical protein
MQLINKHALFMVVVFMLQILPQADLKVLETH